MKYNLYCFKYVPLKGIYKIATTSLNVDILLTSEYKLEFFINIEDIEDLDIFEKLYNYKYNNIPDLYKITYDKVKSLFNKEVYKCELRNLKISHIIDFLQCYIQKSENFQKSQYDKENWIIRSYDLYEIYSFWYKKECSKSPNKEKAGICEFVKLCEKYTFLGPTNEYHEWENVKLKNSV
jgi:hypothetical protein